MFSQCRKNPENNSTTNGPVNNEKKPLINATSSTQPSSYGTGNTVFEQPKPNAQTQKNSYDGSDLMDALETIGTAGIMAAVELPLEVIAHCTIS